jgi:hypothetical protein
MRTIPATWEAKAEGLLEPEKRLVIKTRKKKKKERKIRRHIEHI